VTVPVEIRDRLGLAAGNCRDLELRPDGVSSRRAPSARTPWDRSSGLIKATRPTESLALLDQIADHAPEAVRARRK
jgi:bifunctional DNA-binding transcriptional regulator/antitoxin component of YhaV-PrlF toxin-antitoxin module